MKFIKIGSIRSEYDNFEDERTPLETGKPRWLPSYYDAVKRNSRSNLSKK